MLIPFTKTTRVEILCINITLYNQTWWGNDPLQSISKSEKQTKKSERKLHGLKSQLIFFKLSKRNGANHLIFEPEFPVSHVNGKFLNLRRASSEWGPPGAYPCFICKKSQGVLLSCGYPQQKDTVQQSFLRRKRRDPYLQI